MPCVNTLYYGDNLDVLRRYVKDETVGLVYLDPLFKSDQDYNVLFTEHGTRAAAKIQAFEDTWTWDQTAAAAFEEVVEQGGRVAQAMASQYRARGLALLRVPGYPAAAGDCPTLTFAPPKRGEL